MPKERAGRRLFPLCRDCRALQQGTGYRGPGGNLQQAFLLGYLQLTTAVKGALNMLAPFFVPVKTQVPVDLTERPALSLGIHA